jgi:dihydrodipicolinate reductase
MKFVGCFIGRMTIVCEKTLQRICKTLMVVEQSNNYKMMKTGMEHLMSGVQVMKTIMLSVNRSVYSKNDIFIDFTTKNSVHSKI